MGSGVVSRLRGLWKSLRTLVKRDVVERELSDELAFHVEMETEQNLRAGMSPAEARRAALVSFRGVERYKEEVRASRRMRWVEVWAQDVRSAVRMAWRSPGLAALVVVTLGLGIGATTTIFSVVDAALLAPLPWPDPDRMVLVRETTPEGRTPFTVSAPNYLDFRERSSALVELAAFREAQASLTGEGDPVRLDGLVATHTLFPLLGARPLLGRTFRGDEDRPGADGRVVVLSHGLWQRRFGGDTAVVGSRIMLDGQAHEVAGVLREDFEFHGADLFLPLAPDPASDRMDHWLEVVGRLAPGASRERAESELEAISASLAAVTPAMEGWGVEVRDLKAALVGPEFQRAGAVLAGAVALLLLMACANVANLLLARATARQGDLGVRLALGAGRGRLIRQLLTESGVLAFGGGVLGLLGAVWAVGAVRAAAPSAIPRVEHLAVDLRVVGFAAAVALLTTLLAGLLPALYAAGTDPAERLKAGGRTGGSRRQRRVGDALVVAQVAVALVLLVGAGLMIRSFLQIQAVDPGFRTADVWSVPIRLPESSYDAEVRRFFAFQEIMDGVRAIPGVASVGAAFVDPFSGMNTANDVTPADRAAEVSAAGFMSARWRIVTPSYFETMDVPLLQGRLFTSDDRYDAPPTVVITRTLAERLWPGQDPIGKGLFWGGTDGEPRTVVGVVGDVQDVALAAHPPPLMFLSHRQLIMPSMTLLVRTDGEVAGLAGAIRQAVWAMDPTIPVPEVEPLARSHATALAGPRFNATVLGVFAAVALTLAGVGLYGLLGFIVARRTREIGVRRALGAGTVGVSASVVRRGLALSAAGVGMGLLAALALTRSLESLLFRTAGTDPVTFVAVPVILLLVAGVAAWVPARRAARVSPMIALRGE